MKFFKSLFTAAIVLAVAPTFAEAAKLTTTTTKTHVESFERTTGYNLSGLYIAGQAGISMPNGDTLEDNAVYSGAIGYRINKNYRVEAEAAMRNYDLNTVGISGNTKAYTYTLNGWYDFANTSRFTPYVGGGLGWSVADATANVPGLSFEDHDNAFVYQVGAGVSYDLCKNIALTADYRFVDTSRFTDLGDDIKAHEIRGGVRYSF